MYKRRIWVLALALTLFLFAGAAYMLYSPRWVYEVSINGQPVGYVNSLYEYELIMSDINAYAEEHWSCELIMNEEVSVRRVKVWSRVSSPSQVMAGIQDVATYKTSGWAIHVNGERVALVQSEKMAQDIIEDVKKHYQSSASNRVLVSATIQEDIELVRIPVDPSQLMDHKSVLALLLGGQEKIDTYVVRRGDTLSGIARSYSVSVDTLRNANPNVNKDLIQVGQVLKLESSSAILHVKTVEEVSVTEVIQRAVVYRENPDLSVRHDTIIQSGSDGSRQVTYKVEKVNGSETKRQQISSNIIKSAESRIIMPGSGYWASRPTSMFRFPLNTGSISSRFGAPRDYGPHRGLDIATSRGTPIYAAAGGTVRTRAYNSSYGYYVVIDHSNGYSTLYAHCSSIVSSIRPGQKVVRGQVIAYVGNTGRSTGPHLHWEVRRYNEVINPLNFFGN